ncbi:MAG: hypothetical protein GF311_16275 [Candidatus Lokiarchaeota archaeon]|nr:hypothetical protein [Candidatus Lokiarchaeota archaeon]
MNRTRVKVMIHILAIFLLLSGLVIVHAIINSVIISPDITSVNFFGIIISRVFMLDFSILLIGISFFIEFFLTFRPIQVK